MKKKDESYLLFNYNYIIKFIYYNNILIYGKISY